jgi:hypothetical protein
MAPTIWRIRPAHAGSDERFGDRRCTGGMHRRLSDALRPGRSPLMGSSGRRSRYIGRSLETRILHAAQQQTSRRAAPRGLPPPVLALQRDRECGNGAAMWRAVNCAPFPLTIWSHSIRNTPRCTARPCKKSWPAATICSRWPVDSAGATHPSSDAASRSRHVPRAVVFCARE